MQRFHQCCKLSSIWPGTKNAYQALFSDGREIGKCSRGAHQQPQLDSRLASVFSAFHVVVLLFVMNMLAVAQQPSQPDPNDKVTAEQVNEANVQLMRQDIRAQRKKIVAANLPLTETEASKFWVLYDQYIAETIKINDGRYALIKDYAKNYQSMTDDQSDTFITRWLGFDSDDTQLRLRYVPEFQKVISHQKTAMFFQIDRRVSMMLNLQLSGQVPLVNP